MVEQPESVDTSEQQRKPEPITDVTRWVLMSEIRVATHGKRNVILRPDGYVLQFGEGDSDVTVYCDGSEEAAYRLYVDDPGSAAKFAVSDSADPRRRVELDEAGGRWFRELIAEGNRWKSSPKGRA